MRYMFRRFAACLMSLMLAFSWTAAQAEQEPLLPDLDKLEALLDAFTDVMYGQEFTGFRADASEQAPQVVYGLTHPWTASLPLPRHSWNRSMGSCLRREVLYSPRKIAVT